MTTRYADRSPESTTRPATAAAVQCHQVSKRFGSGPAALDDVSVDCPEGQILVLVGPSGCGKTTLLRCIAGLDTPSSGRIVIAGQDTSRVPAQDRGVAMVFQNYALYPDKSVAANIAFPLKMKRVNRAERTRRVQEVAELLQIAHLLERKPGQLSGGQKQRVGIGRALARRPRVLLMDEPLSNLDAQLRVEMRAQLLALQRSLGTSMVYVTHDQTEALTLADQVAVLRAGRLEQIAPPEVAFGAPATRFTASFLGAMNLWEGEIHSGGESGHVEVAGPGGGFVTLPAEALPSSGPEPFALGVRPEHLSLVSASSPVRQRAHAYFRGPVRLVELLGTEKLVHVEIGATLFRARIPAEAGIGEEIVLTCHADQLHFFGAGTDGKRLR